MCFSRESQLKSELGRLESSYGLRPLENRTRWGRDAREEEG